MSFYAEEISNQGGSPTRLYEFDREGIRWRFTSADRDIEWGGSTFTAIAMKDDGITQSGEAQANTFSVTMPDDNPIVELYRSTPPSDTVFLTVRDVHEFDGVQEAPVQWVGFITDIQRPTAGQATVVCAALSASFQRPGLRLTWMRTCPHALYDASCRVDKAAYRVNGAVATVTGTTVTAPALAGYPDDHFSGGFLEWAIAPGVYERRGIEKYLPDGTLRMFGRTDGMTVGMAFFAYPGCSRTIHTCETKFNNTLNYGGVKDLPGFSPFDGNPVFN